MWNRSNRYRVLTRLATSTDWQYRICDYEVEEKKYPTGYYIVASPTFLINTAGRRDVLIKNDSLYIQNIDQIFKIINNYPWESPNILHNIVKCFILDIHINKPKDRKGLLLFTTPLSPHYLYKHITHIIRNILDDGSFTSIKELLYFTYTDMDSALDRSESTKVVDLKTICKQIEKLMGAKQKPIIYTNNKGGQETKGNINKPISARDSMVGNAESAFHMHERIRTKIDQKSFMLEEVTISGTMKDEINIAITNIITDYETRGFISMGPTIVGFQSEDAQGRKYDSLSYKIEFRRLKIDQVFSGTLHNNTKVCKAKGKIVKWAVFSDPHIPYHNPHLIEVFLSMCKSLGIVNIIFNGDFFDLEFASSYQKNLNHIHQFPIDQALDYGMKLLRTISTQFNKKIFIEGNHDERLGRGIGGKDLSVSIASRVDGMSDINHFSISALFGAPMLGFQCIPYPKYFTLGDLIIKHGDTHTKAINIDTMTYKILMSHVHRPSSAYKPTWDAPDHFRLAQVIRTGTMHNLLTDIPAMSDSVRKNWCNGFAILTHNTNTNDVYIENVVCESDHYMYRDEIYYFKTDIPKGNQLL